jgi:hypothetical protein
VQDEERRKKPQQSPGMRVEESDRKMQMVMQRPLEGGQCHSILHFANAVTDTNSARVSLSYYVTLSMQR